MANKQKSLQDVSNAIEKAAEALNEIQRRAQQDKLDLTFEQKIINAVKCVDNGDPIKDFLNESEIIEALKILADIYTVTGVKMPENWD